MTDLRHLRTESDGALLTGRLFLAAVFLFSGTVKALDWQGAIGEFEQIGVPFAPVAVAATVAVQLLAGLAIVIGGQVRAATAALAAFTVAATLIGHPFWTFEGVEFRRQLTTTLEHLAIVGGFLLLAIAGPGRFSMDGKEPET